MLQLHTKIIIVEMLVGVKLKSIFFYDNIDPLYFEKEFTDINISETGFIIISK